MEKQAVIREGVTPEVEPGSTESDECRRAEDKNDDGGITKLANDVRSRAAAVVREKLTKQDC